MSDGNWRHSICDPCWDEIRLGETPNRGKSDEDRQCCFCQDWHDSGLFVHMHPKNIENHIDHYDDGE